jgi:hypothetical protein
MRQQERAIPEITEAVWQKATGRPRGFVHRPDPLQEVRMCLWHGTYVVRRTQPSLGSSRYRAKDFPTDL